MRKQAAAEAKQRAEDEAARRKAEEAKRKAKEEARIKAEQDKERKAADEAAKKAADEKARKAAPDVRTAMDALFPGGGSTLFATGDLSSDQIKTLWLRDYGGKMFRFKGRIADVGIEDVDPGNSGKKYITINIKGHSFDLYPATEFDILDFRKNAVASFTGVWEYLGTGTLLHHKIQNVAPDP